MESHDNWLSQIQADLDGELTLIEQAALARHLATCPHCAGARASHLEVRVAAARAAGEPHARVAPRRASGARVLLAWAGTALLAGLVAGWGAHRVLGAPGGGAVDGVRAAIVVR